MDEMNYQFYGAPQSYPQTPVQGRFSQRRPSSSGSLPQPQVFLEQPFQPQVGSLDLEQEQFPFNSSNHWSPGHVESAGCPTNAASQFDAAELNVYTRSAHELPWTHARGTQAGTVDNSLQLYPPVSVPYRTKAYTVAGVGYSPGVKRPSLGPRQSFVSIPDSGYASQRTAVDSIQCVPQAEVKSLELITFDAPQIPNGSRKRAHSIKTDPNPEGNKPSKRRKSKACNDSCKTCGKELRNPSEGLKHELQHTKPYRCDVAKCPRTSGFATRNDLERHKKSVHNVSPKVGKKSVYHCQGCRYMTPGSKPKAWPRLDNFKAHIKRKHLDWNEEVLIQASEQEEPIYPESQLDYSHYSVSNPANDMDYQQELSSPVGNMMSRHASQSQQQDMNILFGQNPAHQIAHVGGVGVMADYQANMIHDQQIQFRMPHYSIGDGLSLLHLAANQQLSSPVESAISPTNTRQSAPEIYIDDSAVSQYAGTDMSTRETKRLRTYSMPSSSVSHATISPTVSSAVSMVNTEGGEMHPCTFQGCVKVKRRECDLRKHMKRHTRPYGCTFAKCTKRFGSRNDWKRHENSQHFLSEMWRCQINRPNSQTRCGHLSHDQLQFTQHLANCHDYKLGTEEIRNQARDMHLGREGHHHFWCGFCNKLIEQAEGIQPGAWDVRFKHIGDHFDKENLNIDNWIDIEKNLPKKKLVDYEEQNKKAASKLRVDDDSDLGEDGIPTVYLNGHLARVRRVVEEEVDADGVSDDDMDM